MNINRAAGAENIARICLADDATGQQCHIAATAVQAVVQRDGASSCLQQHIAATSAADAVVGHNRTGIADQHDMPVGSSTQVALGCVAGQCQPCIRRAYYWGTGYASTQCHKHVDRAGP